MDEPKMTKMTPYVAKCIIFPIEPLDEMGFKDDIIPPKIAIEIMIEISGNPFFKSYQKIDVIEEKNVVEESAY